MNTPAGALPTDLASGFELIKRDTIAALQLTVEHYEHRGTGAVHYHLAADSRENVFLVALRTVPEDSTGVAHILEHTALCGSQRYPVRDPFFMMLRRSLNTFMNAFTSSDWTAYPFASQNRKDFDNLLDVYLDAVFFARLDPLDFAQEGHRVEFSEADNPDSPLVYKGVVYNEMKGAMSAEDSVLWHTLCEHLFPSVTYHYNSGGDPEKIVDLTHEQLLAFYRSHYHPSNAIFMTFGDIPAAEHQAAFEDKALRQFRRLPEQIAVPLEQRLAAPVHIEASYAVEDDSDLSARTHIVMGWLLGEAADLTQLLEARLLSEVLLDNSASPLLHALETTPLGQSPSPLCGLEDSMRQMVFACGIAGSEPEHRAALETLVLEVLERVAREGVALETLEAVLHQLELQQREIGGGSMPYGLQLILQALSPATHYRDPIGALNLEPVLATLRERIQHPDYIGRLARQLLLENPHRVTLVLTPDATLAERRRAQETARLAAQAAAMDASARAQVRAQALALQARQQREDDPDVLPRVTLADVPTALPDVPRARGGPDAPLSCYACGTNGLVYEQALLPLPELSADGIDLLPVYTDVLTELGIGEAGYLAVQQRQAAYCGGISAGATVRGAVDDEQSTRGYLVLSAKALARHHREQSTLLRDTLHDVRFDERNRLRELVAQQRVRREQSVTSAGHGLAMTAACAGMSPAAALQHRLAGLAGIRAIKAQDRALAEDANVDALASQLRALHDILQAQPVQHLLIGESEPLAGYAEAATAIWSIPGHLRQAESALSLPALRAARAELWLTNTQVSFCARAYPTVPAGHADAPALTVLGGFLRNGFLHRTIREQGGAYGGGASQDNSVAAFRFFSYRDPRLCATLADFDAAIAWLLQTSHSARALEEAILGVVSSIDKPSSPAGEARQHFQGELFGRNHAHRERFRRGVLELTVEDLRRVAATYLRPEHASTAVISSGAIIAREGSAVAALGLTTEEL